MTIYTKRLRELAETLGNINGLAEENDAAEFIAATDPQTVLALLDEIERLHARVDSMQMANDMLRATHKTDNQYLLDEIERLRGEGEWEYQGIPIYEDGSEAVGRSIEACREWIESDADPSHWIHEPHNSDLPAVVSYRVERRRKAGPWEPVEGDHR